MNPNLLYQKQQQLRLQRNILLILGLLLLGSNVLLSIFVFSKAEKTIIVPANLTREATIEGGNFSESYIEEMTIFFSSLLLDLTPETIDYKSSILLRFVEPNSYHTLQEYFVQEGIKHKQYNLSTHFRIKVIRILNHGNIAEIEGILMSRFGEESVKESKVTYGIEYKSLDGRLQIVSFKVKEDA